MAQKDEDTEIVARMKKRFSAVEATESDFRVRYNDDMEFLYADSDNQDQWPAEVKAVRAQDKRPMITVNKVHTHWLHVVNQSKENKPTVRIHPTNDQATYEAAEVFEGLVRHIEYASNAQAAYDKAMETMTGGGIGYWRLKTEYADDRSFDQEIRIAEIQDPMTVYFGPHKKRDGSDVMYAFVYEDIARESFEHKYPDAAESSPAANARANDSWMTADTVRVAEYFEIEEKKEFMYLVIGDDGAPQYIRESEASPEALKILREGVKNEPDAFRRRKVDKRTVKWYKVAGDEIVDRGTWPGKYIPIIRVPGEELKTKTGIDRKGLVRYLKDAQRAYNYNASGQLEYGALQAKSPLMASAEAIEGYEQYYASINIENFAYVPYNGIDLKGNPIAPPARLEAPSFAPAFAQGMQDAERQLMMASGQYEATFSEQGNEISGVAIDKRQSQGNRVTFHYLDSLAGAIRFTGKQLIDLIPKIYDAQRIVRILAEDGDEQEIQIDPQAEQALQQREDSEDAKVKTIFNPNVGAFDVVAQVGPNFETRRQEAFDAMNGLLAANPALAQVIGDIWMQNADFPAADKLAERMRNWIPSQILNGGPSEAEQQLQQQVQQLQQALQIASQELADKANEYQIKKQREDSEYLNHLALRIENEKENAIAAFKAETDRLKVLAPAVDPLELDAMIRKMVTEIITSAPPAQDIDPNTMDADEAIRLGAPEITAPLQTPQPGEQMAPQPQGPQQ